MEMTGQRIRQTGGRQLFGHLQRRHVGHLDRNPVGRLMTRVTTDVDAINELFTSGIVTVFGDLFALFGIMGVMLALDWRLALVTFSVIPLFFVVTNWFRRGARQAFRETRRWVARINAFLQENLSGMSVVQLFRREERNRAAFAAVNQKHYEANLSAIFYYAVFYPAIEFLAVLAVALILLYGGGQVLVGGVTLGVLVAFIQYAQRFWRADPRPLPEVTTSCRPPWPRRSGSSGSRTSRPPSSRPPTPIACARRAAGRSPSRT